MRRKKRDDPCKYFLLSRDDPEPLVVSWINWDKLTVLGCKHLRFLKVYVNKGEHWCDWIDDFCTAPVRSGFWVALEEDPCPNCDNKACHNYGVPFHRPSKLIILKKRKR